ncbi:MAG: NADH-quinone oxidoreductase subunit NuoH [Planctomycetia bacterium]|nr:NADH-quinone oxidoreductase subunit NuoH [Planctomycetia bacterium]
MAEFLSRYLWEWAAYVVAALVHVILLLHVLAAGALVFIWLERKVSGRIQDRLGPTRVGGKFGWLQTLADAIKLIAKEDTRPKGADPLLFRLAPYISLCSALAAYMALPFSSGWVALGLSISVFFIVAVLGLEVFGVILAGYASGSKWSLFGGMREAAQVVSYEVPLGLCVVIPVLVCGTMDLSAIADMQRGPFTNWLIFHDPGTFIAFFVFFTCATASVNRSPFDLAEAESELVAGFHTEYSGLRWSIFFMAEYGSMFTVSGLATILFLGGWNGPIPIFDMIGWSYASPADPMNLYGWLANMAGLLNFVIKCVVGVTLMMWVRWTLPRLRIDQVMKTCLKYCMPLACVAFVTAAAWSYALPTGLTRTGPTFGHVRELQPAVTPASRTATPASEAPRAAHATVRANTPAESTASPAAPAGDRSSREAAAGERRDRGSN